MTSFNKLFDLSITCISEKLRSKLVRKPYRDAYMEEQVCSWLARQIRVLREQRGWSQQDLAAQIGTKQSTISRLEDPDYGKYSLKTLMELRAAFDVGLEVKFVPFGEAILRSRDVSSSNMQVSAFNASELDQFWFAPAASTTSKETRFKGTSPQDSRLVSDGHISFSHAAKITSSVGRMSVSSHYCKE